MTRASLLLFLSLVGCGSERQVLIARSMPPPHTPRDVGSSSEVHTPSGARTGFSVRECHRDDAIRGVDCLGATTVPRTQIELAKFHAELDASMKPAAVGIGYGIGCDEADRGFRVYVPRYADVDAAVERAGQLCVERNTTARFSFHLLVESELL